MQWVHCDVVSHIQPVYQEYIWNISKGKVMTSYMLLAKIHHDGRQMLKLTSRRCLKMTGGVTLTNGIFFQSGALLQLCLPD